MKTYFFETYGCEMNIAESAAVEQLLIARGWTVAKSAQVADMAIINTCSVRETAENRIMGRLGWFNGLKAVRAKKLGAKTKMLDEAVEYVKDGAKPLTIVVMGCMAERLLKSFQKDFPFIDYVVGTYAKHHFSEIISAVEEGRKPFEVDDSELYKFASVSAEPGAFSTFVPIMHGCNNFCTYCIVPYVRGREISRPVSEILRELDILNGYGVKEITLIGQNVNSYKDGDTNFAGLLQIIADHLRETKSGIQWVRFMSSHPKDFTDDVIDVIAKEEVICRHIHLPVQHGSTAVLKAMNRRYTREQYLDLVSRIKARIPDVSLTTDIMMGFPGETEQDVEDTLDLMRQVKYESAMMYYYNPREGTPAAKMEQLPEQVRKDRLQRVIDLQLEHTHEQMIKRVGSVMKVLVESISRDDKTELLGQTEQHEKVAFKAERSLIGHFVNVKITELSGNTFRGTLI
ncbi:tRNA-N(6)-(isopentenyl)adenosine-37 thiotransferase enzyme MiaB [Treponema sp. JC4]|uniref:tRNA (N6-isopentenyl adenosine(37)-C2)-methylthiotransferase MiaB n=1 Tax=Treponema sp. JC4 TaxID=1124982 RepID=UPI00025B0BC6|nr:tRNA (N6-isopentenyl adenosine(37)-C2)-methylthiotransferase MiaB [Treponema sp. JC4]EID85942.1 tRNA-N(6)-(isopentenyl)adenosine-37 thiotransferase enzyme MiaB [Treponema sp. JC4]